MVERKPVHLGGFDSAGFRRELFGENPEEVLRHLHGSVGLHTHEIQLMLQKRFPYMRPPSVPTIRKWINEYEIKSGKRKKGSLIDLDEQLDILPEPDPKLVKEHQKKSKKPRKPKVVDLLEDEVERPPTIEHQEMPSHEQWMDRLTSYVEQNGRVTFEDLQSFSKLPIKVLQVYLLVLEREGVITERDIAGTIQYAKF